MMIELKEKLSELEKQKVQLEKQKEQLEKDIKSARLALNEEKLSSLQVGEIVEVIVKAKVHELYSDDGFFCPVLEICENENKLLSFCEGDWNTIIHINNIDALNRIKKIEKGE